LYNVALLIPCLRHHLRRGLAGFLLAQNADDLLFREPASLHRPSPYWASDSTQIWRTSRGSGQGVLLAPEICLTMPAAGSYRVHGGWGPSALKERSRQKDRAGQTCEPFQ
jgi:hypothetical protein